MTNSSFEWRCGVIGLYARRGPAVPAHGSQQGSPATRRGPPHQFRKHDAGEGEGFQVDGRVAVEVVEADVRDHDTAWYDLVGEEREPVVGAEWPEGLVAARDRVADVARERHADVLQHQDVFRQFHAVERGPPDGRY